ncbi:MAG: DNA integrity scanning protein DisA [Actinobacteria bacterium]|nr:DNA integrity scanning protein DisA [Actinomycetota bacterium]MDI6830963.1 DNA integrity scanning diadenylate cyclase DisA [Actinomycetota bacterium]
MDDYRKDRAYLEYLRLIAPGTELREALARLMSSHLGALIVVGDSEEVLKVVDGGVELNWTFSAANLFQVSKMDGAVVLDEELSRIRFANVHLVPDPSIPTRESGTRHRTAERVAKQTGKLVIAVSERMERVTMYKDDWSHVILSVRVLISKASQALQTLEKYKTRLDQVSATLSALEFEDLVSLQDVASVLQRAEMMRRLAEEIKAYLAELGVEGRLVELQMEELMFGVEREKRNVIRDYRVEERGKTVEAVERSLANLSDEELLQLTSVAQALGYSGAHDEMDRPLSPRGYRMLERIPRLPSSVVEKLVRNFKTMHNIMQASEKMLDEVEGVGKVRARAIKEGLRRIAESSLLERYT